MSSAPMPKWPERQPVTIYYEEEIKISEYRKDYSVQHSICGFCYRNFIKKKLKRTKISNKSILICGNQQKEFKLNIWICNWCLEKFLLKSEE